MPLCARQILKIYNRLLSEETSENHQAYRRGHLDNTILNKMRAAKECGRNYFNKNSSTLFLNVKLIDNNGNIGRKTVPDPRSLVKNCEFLDVRTTGMHKN